MNTRIFEANIPLTTLFSNSLNTEMLSETLNFLLLDDSHFNLSRVAVFRPSVKRLPDALLVALAVLSAAILPTCVL
jgi:hypothetical protein